MSLGLKGKGREMQPLLTSLLEFTQSVITLYGQVKINTFLLLLMNEQMNETNK